LTISRRLGRLLLVTLQGPLGAARVGQILSFRPTPWQAVHQAAWQALNDPSLPLAREDTFA
jgi:hypothetical protein